MSVHHEPNPDAALHGAAPDLLAQLKTARNAYYALCLTHYGKVAADTNVKSFDVAIAKAEGRA